MAVDPPETIYYTTFTYDALSRVTDVQTPDGYHITTEYRGPKKIVTNQRGYSTAYTYVPETLRVSGTARVELKRSNG